VMEMRIQKIEKMITLFGKNVSYRIPRPDM